MGKNKPIHGAYKTCANCKGMYGRTLQVLPTCPQAELVLGEFVTSVDACDGVCSRYIDKRPWIEHD